MPATDFRRAALLDWLQTALPHPVETLEPASEDASFRRYFRARIDGTTRIVMDAPPPREDIRPFLKVAALMREAGVRTPGIHLAEPEQGFAVLDDFGTESYLDRLRPDSADRLYREALAALVRLQGRVDVAAVDLPVYDAAFVRRELDIFREWFLGRWLGLEPEAAAASMLERVWQVLVDSALEQPRVCVHRDFHSRNLMVLAEDNPGVLDFQDAVIGPIAYDAVSLLRDCYIAWPEQQVHAWREAFRASLCAEGLLDAAGAERFGRWFDLMGMQRHLKAIGIFARLHLRDGKPGYLKDIPRTLGYVTAVARAYPELAEFRDWLETRVQPSLALEAWT